MDNDYEREHERGLDQDTDYDDFVSQEQEDCDYEAGAELGDPRRCPRHPEVKTSSPDGMFDAPCGRCEMEMDDAAQRDEDNANADGFDIDDDIPF